MIGEVGMCKRTNILTILVAMVIFAGAPVSQAGAAQPQQEGFKVAAVQEQKVVFKVPNMTCPLCPVTVKKAMSGVVGVKFVTVDLDTKTATVIFDPSQATPEDIAAASANAGYPAEPAN